LAETISTASLPEGTAALIVIKFPQPETTALRQPMLEKVAVLLRGTAKHQALSRRVPGAAYDFEPAGLM